MALVQKKLTFWQKLPLLDQKKKIQGFLARRGYDWEIIGQILRSLTAKR
jgi:SOS response regulatory protein OraA/RecX